MNHRPEMSVHGDPWGEDIPIGDSDHREPGYTYEPPKVKVSGPIPVVMLDNGSDKRAAPDGAWLVTLILCAVLLAVMAAGWAVLA